MRTLRWTHNGKCSAAATGAQTRRIRFARKEFDARLDLGRELFRNCARNFTRRKVAQSARRRISVQTGWKHAARPMLISAVNSTSLGLKGGVVRTLSLIRRRVVAAACAAVVVGAVGGPATAAELEQALDRVDREAALRLFQDRVEDYARLHRRLEGPLPPLTTTRNMMRNYIARQLLANAIRKARAGVQQGVIFSADVATVFRAMISDALAGQDVETFLRELHAEHPGIEDVRPVINEPLPAETTHEMPIVLLHILPALPEDIEYRIVHRDLVLWDIHADLVIDYVPNAFGRSETTF
jgi:hypothetical protein